MVALIHLLAVSGLAAAIEIKFVRFADDHCGDAHHIRKDTNLHDPHCKEFSDNELPFTSFKYKLTGETKDLAEKYCYLTAWTGKNCDGEQKKFDFSFDDNQKCLHLEGLEARGVRLACEKKPVTPQFIDHPVTKVLHDTVTETHHPTNYPTMTVVPKPEKKIKVCHWEDAENAEEASDEEEEQ